MGATLITAFTGLILVATFGLLFTMFRGGGTSVSAAAAGERSRRRTESGAALITAIRGPILLISLGSLFTLDHFGSYSFTRTWPVLIIVFGVLKLLERGTGSGPTPTNV